MLFYNIYGDCTGHYKYSGARIAVDVGTFAACIAVGASMIAAAPALAILLAIGVISTVAKDQFFDDKKEE